MTGLDKTLKAIAPVDRSLEAAVQVRLDHLTKPQGSLGRLEEIVKRYCQARQKHSPKLTDKAIYTFAADHGVAEEGVSAFPPVVTVQMVHNMAAGGAAINVLARHVGAELHIVDIGVNDPLTGVQGLLRHKVRSGTANTARGPAMTLDEARQAIEVGITLATDACRRGVTLLGTGEMGIANTTTSSALLAALLGCSVESITGLGTGITDKQLQHKRHIVRQILTVNADRLTDPLNTLAAVGGLEIAGICGLILGGAAQQIPTVVDGFISSAGAAVAIKLCPAVADYLFFSHLSAEAGHGVMLAAFKQQPLLDLGLRLGEGTGAALAMSLIDAALKIYRDMATFDSAGVDREEETTCSPA